MPPWVNIIPARRNDLDEFKTRLMLHRLNFICSNSHHVVRGMLSDININHLAMFIKLVWPHCDITTRGKIISVIVRRYINNDIESNIALMLLMITCAEGFSSTDTAIISKQVCGRAFNRWLANSDDSVTDDIVINFIIDMGFLGTTESLSLNYRWNSLRMIKYLLEKNPDLLPGFIYELFIRRKNYVISEYSLGYIIDVKTVVSMSYDARSRLNMMIATHYYVPIIARVVTYLCKCGYNADALMDTLRQITPNNAPRSMFQYRRLCNTVALFVS